MPAENNNTCKKIGEMLGSCMDNKKNKPSDCKFMMDLYLDCLSQSIKK